MLGPVKVTSCPVQFELEGLGLACRGLKTRVHEAEKLGLDPVRKFVFAIKEIAICVREPHGTLCVGGAGARQTAVCNRFLRFRPMRTAFGRILRSSPSTV